jgi:Uma2 family endonuclease
MATKALFRAEELETIQSDTGRKFELVRGELYEMVTGYRHGQLVPELAFLLASWRKQTRAGDVLSDAGFTLERNPDTVRGPNVSFVRKGRFPAGPPVRGYPDIAPDAAFEVRSPNDSWPELVAKAGEYLAKGCQLVVLIEADQFAEVHRPGRDPKRLGLDDVFDGEDVLPGFSCRVRDFFPEEPA